MIMAGLKNTVQPCIFSLTDDYNFSDQSLAAAAQLDSSISDMRAV